MKKKKSKKKTRLTNYQKNINALNQIESGVLDWFKDQPEIDWIEKIKCENGDNNFIVQSGSQPLNAYSMDKSRNS